MNWFTYTLIVLAVIGVGVLVWEVVLPRRSRVDGDTRLRERDHGRGTEVDGSGLDRKLRGGSGGL